MELNWTTIAASGITALVICTFQFFTTRYLGRMLDSIEKRMGITGSTAAANKSTKGKK